MENEPFFMRRRGLSGHPNQVAYEREEDLEY
jgi:hypothetical protein